MKTSFVIKRGIYINKKPLALSHLHYNDNSGW